MEAGEYSGYRSLISCQPNGINVVASYKITAEPIGLGKAGFSAFCTSESGLVWYDRTGSGEKCLTSRTLLP